MGSTSAFLQPSSLHRHGSPMATSQQPLSSGESSLHATNPPFHLQHIDHVVIRCKNFEPMFHFYHRILGCTVDEPAADHINRFGGALTHLRAGSCYIDLIVYDREHLSSDGVDAVNKMHAGGQGVSSIDNVSFSSATSTLDHLCIRVEPFDEKQIIEYLERERVPIVVAGGNRLGADGVGRSIYVSDPEGNVVELKGPPVKSSSPQSHMNEDEETPIQLQTRVSPKSDADPQSIEARDNKDTFENQTDGSIDDKAEEVSATPCIRICRYNSSFQDGQVCIGCYRDTYEIQAWQSMTAMEKAMTLLDATDRCDASDGTFEGAITRDELIRQYKYWEKISKSS
jgi:glyoxylase I family protein